MIDIQELSSVPPEMLEFQKREWQIADQKHFGRKVRWEKEKKVLTASDNGELCGVLELRIQAGVMTIDSLIVKHDVQGKGIGKALMLRAEHIAKDNQLHKIFLDTGKNWPATGFYEALGYTKTGDLIKHLDQQDFVLYSKFL